MLEVIRIWICASNPDRTRLGGGPRSPSALVIIVIIIIIIVVVVVVDVVVDNDKMAAWL